MEKTTGAKKRSFSIHPEMIYSLIKAQAGTLSKAVLENVMNSIDAGANKVLIDITRTTLSITDNGHGFRSIDEINECFDVFGFPHEAGNRTFGQFGIGRAQAWSFTSAIWKTNTFCMNVDIKNRGLDYELLDNQVQVDGLQITSKFYTPQTTHEIELFKQELTELALYAEISIILNGVEITQDRSKVKWTHETADAWIRLTDSSYLTVYNLGVLVRKFSASQLGGGGTVVTKPGVRLALNMARNDILVTECKAWSRIRPYIQKKTDEAVAKKSTRLSMAELDNRASRFLSGELTFEEVEGINLITDITGKGCTIAKFMYPRNGYGSKFIITTAPDGSRLGERAHLTKIAFVVHPKTIFRFGANSLEEMLSKLQTAIERVPVSPYNWWYANFKKNAVCNADLASAVPSISEEHILVPEKEWTTKEDCVMRALKDINKAVKSHVASQAEALMDSGYRSLKLGTSDTALAWTDSVQIIVFTRNLLKSADKGIGGFVRLVSTFVHEYLHDIASVGSHAHDDDFYQKFHDLQNSEKIGELAFRCYKNYTQYLLKAGIAPTQQLLEALSLEERLETATPRIKRGKPAIAA